MDEQNPRVGAERIGGRGDDRLTGRVPSGPVAANTDTTGTRPRPRSAGTGARSTRPQDSTSSASTDASADARTREIREDIEETREELSETVNAIQERLRPGNIAANAAENVKQVAREKARDVAESEPVQYARANPIPTAMVGIGIAGLAWLAMAGRERSSYRTGRGWDATDRSRRRYSAEVDLYEGYGAYSGRETADVPGTWYGAERAYGAYGSETSNIAESGTGATAGRGDVRWGSSLRQRTGMSRVTRGTQENLRRTWNENPLLVGAACAVIGAVAGLAIPETEREHRLMGETRDNLVETVQDTVRDKVEKVQEAASNAVSTVQDAAATAVGLKSGESEQSGSTIRGNS